MDVICRNIYRYKYGCVCVRLSERRIRRIEVTMTTPFAKPQTPHEPLIPSPCARRRRRSFARRKKALLLGRANTHTTSHTELYKSRSVCRAFDSPSRSHPISCSSSSSSIFKPRERSSSDRNMPGSYKALDTLGALLAVFADLCLQYIYIVLLRFVNCI